MLVANSRHHPIKSHATRQQRGTSFTNAAVAVFRGSGKDPFVG
jgi:hypothetical protein